MDNKNDTDKNIITDCENSLFQLILWFIRVIYFSLFNKYKWKINEEYQ